MNKAVFFDRDGVLNEIVERDGGHYSPQTFSQFKIIEEAIQVTRHTHSVGFLNIVISNQPDIARKKLDKVHLDKMTDQLYKKLELDDVFYCTHDDKDFCECRKPLSGLFLQASKKWDINLEDSYMVGDSWKDIEAAKNVNIDSFLLDRSYNTEYLWPKRVKNLEEVTKLIGK